MMFIMTNIYYICLLYMFVACYVDLRLSADDWWLAYLVYEEHREDDGCNGEGPSNDLPDS